MTGVSIETPLSSHASGAGLSDIYIRPFELGWHKKRAGIRTAYGFYAPSGRFEPGGSKNMGLGMWSHEISVGSTVHLGKTRQWNLATTTFYNLQSAMKNTDHRVGYVLWVERDDLCAGAGGQACARAAPVNHAPVVPLGLSCESKKPTAFSDYLPPGQKPSLMRLQIDCRRARRR